MDHLQLFLAAILIVGFSLVLYTAPIKYTRAQKVIMIAGGCAFFLIAVWHAGVRITFVVLSQYIEPAKIEEAREKAAHLQLPPRIELAAVAIFAIYWFTIQLKRAFERTKQWKSERRSNP